MDRQHMKCQRSRQQGGRPIDAPPLPFGQALFTALVGMSGRSVHTVSARGSLIPLLARPTARRAAAAWPTLRLAAGGASRARAWAAPSSAAPAQTPPPGCAPRLGRRARGCAGVWGSGQRQQVRHQMEAAGGHTGTVLGYGLTRQAGRPARMPPACWRSLYGPLLVRLYRGLVECRQADVHDVEPRQCQAAAWGRRAGRRLLSAAQLPLWPSQNRPAGRLRRRSKLSWTGVASVYHPAPT